MSYYRCNLVPSDAPSSRSEIFMGNIEAFSNTNLYQDAHVYDILETTPLMYVAMVANEGTRKALLRVYLELLIKTVRWGLLLFPQVLINIVIDYMFSMNEYTRENADNL